MTAYDEFVRFPDETDNDAVVMLKPHILAICPDYKDAYGDYVHFKGREKPIRISCSVETAWKVMQESGEE